MKRAIIEVRIKVAIDVDWHGNPEPKAQAIKNTIESNLKSIPKLKVQSCVATVKRTKPSLSNSQRQWKLAVVGGWALPVPLEPVVIGKPCKTAETMSDALVFYVANGASIAHQTATFNVLRRKSGDYIAIGIHEEYVLQSLVIGKLAKLPRQKPSASDSR